MDSYQLITGQSWSKVAYGTSRRDMPGVSEGSFAGFNLGLHCGDVPEHAQANRERLKDLLPYAPIWLNQVHGIAVYDADVEQSQDKTADAAVTTRSDCVLAIMTADCLPVVFACDDGTVIAAAHAGWRGLCAGVLEEAVKAMRHKMAQLGIQQQSIRAWIGPAISYDCFEVGEEVLLAFTQLDAMVSQFFKPHPSLEGKWFADLPAIAKYRLNLQGVQEVELSHYCTFQEANLFYSYRRESPTGRLATFVWKTTNS